MSPTSYQAAPARVIDTPRLAALTQPGWPQVPDEWPRIRARQRSPAASQEGVPGV